jgi:LPXTG-motif cell wall-anchored protein
VVGHEYTVKGVLMDKATGEGLLIGGQEVTSEAKFTPEEKDGSVDIAFTFDARGLEGTKVVAFESLYVKDVEVAVHADIEDDDQTVEFPEPKIGTTAVNAGTGTHEAAATRDVAIVDTVKYKNLVVGQEYTVKGVLMDKATGEKLLVDGKEVTSESKFTPKEKEGSIDIAFTFDARGLAGHEVVAFETLYAKDDEVAVHADIEDDGQTVEIREPEKPPVPKTGDEGNALPVAAALMAGSLAALAAGGTYAWKRRRKGGKPGNPEPENTPDGKNDKDVPAGEDGAGRTR